MKTARAVVDYWHTQLDAAERALDDQFDVYTYETRSDLLAETADQYLLDKAPNTYPIEQDFAQTAMSDQHPVPEISIVEAIKARSGETDDIRIGSVSFKEPIPYDGGTSVGRATVEYRATADTEQDTVERYFTVDTDAITADDADVAAYVEQIQRTLTEAGLPVHPETTITPYSDVEAAASSPAVND